MNEDIYFLEDDEIFFCGVCEWAGDNPDEIYLEIWDDIMYTCPNCGNCIN